MADAIRHFGNWLRWEVAVHGGPVKFARNAGFNLNTIQKLFVRDTDEGLRDGTWVSLEAGLHPLKREEIAKKWRAQPRERHPNLTIISPGDTTAAATKRTPLTEYAKGLGLSEAQLRARIVDWFKDQPDATRDSILAMKRSERP